jgi:hypothetical protein
MTELPFELILDIIELAMLDDQRIMAKFCLISRAVNQIVSSKLYSHVCLSGSDQVKLFNRIIKSYPQIWWRIQGFSLFDDDEIPLPFRHDKAKTVKPSWVSHWKLLFYNFGVLSQQRRLPTLVISRQVYTRLKSVNGTKGKCIKLR